MKMTKVFNFTAEQFIAYLETVDKEMAAAQQCVRDFMVEFAENEFKRANPIEYKKYCLMQIQGRRLCN